MTCPRAVPSPSIMLELMTDQHVVAFLRVVCMSLEEVDPNNMRSVVLTMCTSSRTLLEALTEFYRKRVATPEPMKRPVSPPPIHRNGLRPVVKRVLKF